jgi:hypothetical protein
MKKNNIVTIILLSTLVLSCGKNEKTKEFSKTNENLETEMAGIYQAILLPLNKQVSGHLNGSLTLVKSDDEFIADVRLSGGPKSVLQSQGIHIGERCPGEEEDINKDGYIDGEEGAEVYNEILLPLDDDLSSQRIGLGIFPVTDVYGSYFWSRATSFEKMMTDLREEDINLTDDYVKLPASMALSPIGKVVIIRGVPKSYELPATVLGRGRQGPHEGLPIACGIIKKLQNVPGEIDHDKTGIPVPSPDYSGGFAGTDDGAIFPTRETTGETGNYGEGDESLL